MLSSLVPGGAALVIKGKEARTPLAPGALALPPTLWSLSSTSAPYPLPPGPCPLPLPLIPYPLVPVLYLCPLSPTPWSLSPMVPSLLPVRTLY